MIGKLRPIIAVGAALTLIGACSRSDLYVRPAQPPPPECLAHEDCPGFDDVCEPVRCVDPVEQADLLPEPPPGRLLPPLVCAVVFPVDCDDGDPCTEDSCDAETGGCDHGPATLDLDGDGHNAILPGTEPGSVEACGDDCNDASAAAFPGNTEICDGVDNDCNGVVDDGATFIPLDNMPIRISESAPPYGPNGLAFNGDNYLAIYTSGNTDLSMFETMVQPDGTKVPPIEELFTFQNADAAGGSLSWIGDRFGISWSDRRDGTWETYFTLLKPDGEKAIADTRLSGAGSTFSVNNDLAWNGSEFLVAWQDDAPGSFEIFLQRVSVDGVPVGGNIQISPSNGQDQEAPSIASGEQTVAIAWTTGGAGSVFVRFATFEQNSLNPVSAVIDLTPAATEAIYPNVVWNEDRYMVVWHERSGPVRAVFAATLDEQGTVITPPTQISEPPGNAISRDPALLPLGDRALIVFADNRDDAEGRHELYSRMVTNDLTPLTGEVRLTTAAKDSIEPVMSFGPDGNVAVFFRDDRLLEQHVWMTRLGCVTN